MESNERTRCPHCGIENFKNDACCWQCHKPIKDMPNPSINVSGNPAPENLANGIKQFQEKYNNVLWGIAGGGFALAILLLPVT